MEGSWEFHFLGEMLQSDMGVERVGNKAGNEGPLPTWLGKTFIRILCFRSWCRMRSLSSALIATFWQTAIIRLSRKTAAISRRRSRMRPVS